MALDDKTLRRLAQAAAMPRSVNGVIRAFEESRPADIGTSRLENTLAWLQRYGPAVEDRDGDLVVDLILDELSFRAS